MEAGTVDGSTGRQAAPQGPDAGRMDPRKGTVRTPRPRPRTPSRPRSASEPQFERGQALQAVSRYRQPSGCKIGEHIGVKVGETKLQRFADGEVFFQLLENVRGVDVFVVQPTCYPVDQHLVELLVMIDALKRASAARITVVMPYYGYARQDRKDKPRVAISAKLIADLLTTAGANRALFVDLHAAQIQGFFNIPVDHLVRKPGAGELFQGTQSAQPDGDFA